MSSFITDLAELAGKALSAGKLTLATAESCTGGGIAEAITRIAGSSAWFERGWVTYSNYSKEQELGVDAEVLAKQGAVSEAVVLAMAEGARLRAQTDWAVAVSGIAGPDGGSVEKPVGTVWLAWVGPDGAYTEKHVFPGGREAVRKSTVEMALRGLLNKLELARSKKGV
jgi:nicotinamide-nucleotide amidase